MDFTLTLSEIVLFLVLAFTAILVIPVMTYGAPLVAKFLRKFL